MNTTTNRFLALQEMLQSKRKEKKGGLKIKPGSNGNKENIIGNKKERWPVAAKSANGIQFSPDANQDVVSNYTKGVLHDVMVAAGITSLKITSTARTPEEQARAMYTNIVNGGVQDQLDLYGSGGDAVIRAYLESKNRGNTKEQIIQDMVAEILNQGPQKVSRHAADFNTLNVVDIAPSSIAKKPEFEQAVRNEGRVSKFLTPGDNDPAYHLEIPQPQSEGQGLVSSLSSSYWAKGGRSIALEAPPTPIHGIADRAAELAADSLIMESYKGFHNFVEPWGFFFTQNKKLGSAYPKPNWDVDLVNSYNDSSSWKPVKILKMIARDMLGENLPRTVKNDSQKEILKQAYDTWKDDYYAVFWGEGHVCNLFVGEALYRQGLDFLMSNRHYYAPKQMDKGANGKLVEITFDQAEKGDFFTLNNVHTGVIVEKSSSQFKTREGTVDDSLMGVIRTRSKSDSGLRFWRYRQQATGQSLVADFDVEMPFGEALSGRNIKNYKIPQIAYLMAEGVGVNGTYTVYGYIIVEDEIVDWKTNETKKVIKVSAMGKTAASKSGKVKFWGNAELLVNGNVVDTEGFVYPKGAFVTSPDTIMIGDAKFDYPVDTDHDQIEVKITGGYIFSTGHGSAVPMPGSTNDTFDLP